jgi:hypothetical protein
MENDSLVFVEVVDFPGGLLTPVRAARQHRDCYRLLESSNDPEHDVWRFTKGAVVRCVRREFSAGEYGLVAVATCSCAADAPPI